MSFFDDASLVFLPSGGAGKDGKAYSMKPTDGSGDFTFSRGSNLTATRIDSNGLIEKGRENLLTYSNDFSQWGTTNASVTSGQSGYDGSSDAWELESLSNGFYRRVSQSVTQTGVITFSIYAKSANTDFLLIYNNQNGHKAWFDLSSGSLGNLSGAIDSSIEDIGNGYYRCSISLITSASSQFWICPTNGNNVASCDLGNSIYIQDAQLEIGLVATEYIESGATTGLAGILEDSPRFDYSGGASCPSLLLEPSRANLVRSSEALIHGSYGWILGNSTTLTLNDAISPEGVQNAFRLDIPTAINTTLARCNVLESTEYTFSFYVKRGTATELKYSVFNFSNLGNIVATTSYFSQTNTDDFVRIVVPFTTPVGCTDVGVYLDRDSGANGSAWFYGIQLEQGSYATSYIPNHSGGSVTRSADSSTSGTISNVTEGVLFFEGSVLKNNNTVKLVEFNDGGLSNVIQLYYRDSVGSVPRVYAIAKEAGSQVYGTAYNIPSGRGEDTHKVAFRFEDNNFALFYNGTKVHSQTSGTISTNPKNQLMYETSAAAIPFRGNVKQTLVFGTALSDADCITLTS